MMTALRGVVRPGSRRAVVLGTALFLGGLLLFKLGLFCANTSGPDLSSMITPQKYVIGSDRRIYTYDRNMPLIFIGGVPRSGTTLMRAMLDAHPDVRCGQETRVIPRLLQLRFHWLKSERESLRLDEAGITKPVLDAAIAAFCLEVIARHGDPAARLCNKDPLTIKMGTYVVELFPNAKFIFMVRDGRATAHSIISRKVTITGFDLSSYRQCLKRWNTAVEAMNNQCRELGPNRCLRVPYEQLVLHPRMWMHKVLEFLDVPWNETVLHHQDFINNGISLSKVERSSDQVIKPINMEALTKWVGHIPEDVIRDMADIAPMLSVLGNYTLWLLACIAKRYDIWWQNNELQVDMVLKYDPYANPPSYGQPDDVVADNTRQVLNNPDEWARKAKELFQPRNDVEETLLDDVASDTPQDNQIPSR